MEPEKRDETVLPRRSLLVGLGGLGTAGLAGCLRLSSSEDADETATGDQQSADATGTRSETAVPEEETTTARGTDRQTTATDDGSLSGQLALASDNAVYPILRTVGQLFGEEYADVGVSLAGGGTDAAFGEAFVTGEASVLGASRPLTEDERAACEDNGFDPVELSIATDPVTVIVNNDNDWVGGMTGEQLSVIWSSDGLVETWDDAAAEWPDEEIELYGPSTGTGTFDYFTREILAGTDSVREDFQGTVSYGQIVDAVERNRLALGYLPFAFYAANPDRVQAVRIDSGGTGPVDPTLETARTGAYPLSRPLFVYLNSARLGSEPQVEAFARFLVERSTSGEVMAETVGYLPSSRERADANLETIESYTE